MSKIDQNTYTMVEYKKVMELRDRGFGNVRISKLTNIPRSTIALWFRGAVPKRFSKKAKQAQMKNLIKARLKLREFRKEKLNELSRRISSDFGYVLGTVLGDGYVTFPKSGGGYIGLSVVDRDFALAFKNSLEKWTGIKSRFYRYEDRWRVYLHSVVAAKFLKNFNTSKLLHVAEDVKCAFLKGLFDSEGTISIASKRIRFYNSNIRLVNLVKTLLCGLGVEKVKIYKRGEEIHTIKGRECLIKPLYTVYISTRKNLEIFEQKIRFSIKRKQEKLERILKTYQRSCAYWTADEINFLRKNSYRNYHKIAKDLGRNVNSVRKALYRYNIKPSRDNRLLP